MEKKKKKMKWREIRSAVTMMCVMAAMLSTATFAWFTLTDSPTVTNMQMTATSTGGLVVAPENEDASFVNAMEIELDNTNGEANPLKLQPVSVGTKDAKTGFCLPQYSGGLVTGLKAPMAKADLENIVAVYTYYIKAVEGDVGVGIITGDATTTNPVTVTGTGASAYANAAGTFVRSKAGSADQATGDAAEAIRMGLVVTDVATEPDVANMIVLEPNNDSHENVGLATVTSAGEQTPMTGPTADVSFEKQGAISSGGTGTTSEYLFTASTTAKKVTMYVWLEGTDADCIDQIKTDVIEAQIQFTTVEIPNP